MGAHTELGLSLLVAHLAGDFALRSGPDVGEHRSGSRLLGHAAVIAGLSFLLAGRWQAWAIPVVTLTSHAMIDWMMARRPGRSAAMFVLDQAAHVAVIAALILFPGLASEHSSWLLWCGNRWGQVLILAAGAILCVRVAGVLVGYLVRPYLDEIEKVQAHSAAAIRGLSVGGRVIGQWERALILLFLLMNLPAAIGFLITAKSIFRFGELKDRENRMEAEYITIGTLMSFTLAIGTAWLTVQLLRVF